MPAAPCPGNQVVMTADTRAPGVPAAVLIMSLTAQGHQGKGRTGRLACWWTGGWHRKRVAAERKLVKERLHLQLLCPQLLCPDACKQTAHQAALAYQLGSALQPLTVQAATVHQHNDDALVGARHQVLWNWNKRILLVS